jgi:hypothetical protein
MLAGERSVLYKEVKQLYADKGKEVPLSLEPTSLTVYVVEMPSDYQDAQQAVVMLNSKI